MQHAIQLDRLGPQGPVMADAIGSCVHCGFCLAACPTYVTLAEETDSPRGRIVLMKEVLEGASPRRGARADRPLPGVPGVVTACPTGVAYGDLIAAYRAHVEEKRPRTFAERLQRALVARDDPVPAAVPLR